VLVLALERSGVAVYRSPRFRFTARLEVVAIQRDERTVSGDHGDGETPVPIPNTEVKPISADGTWGESPWESRTSPGFLSTKAPHFGDGPLSRSGIDSGYR